MDAQQTRRIIEVKAYSGYKANERPQSLLIDDTILTVKRIIKRWAEPERDCYDLLASDGKRYIVCWIRDLDVWALERVYHSDV
jgi:hypothetical protein